MLVSQWSLFARQSIQVSHSSRGGTKTKFADRAPEVALIEGEPIIKAQRLFVNASKSFAEEMWFNSEELVGVLELSSF